MTSWTGSRVLVIGGAGFVGGRLVTELVRLGVPAVVIVDNLLSSERWNVPEAPAIDFVEGSAGDDEVLNKLGIDFTHVFHLATYHGNQSSIANPLEDHANNLLPTLKLLERFSGARRLERFVYAASGCVLAPHTLDDPEPVDEEGAAPFDLDSPYQISKVVGEMYALYYAKQHQVPTVRARFQNVYGPGEVLGAGRWRGTPATVWRNVTPTFVYQALHRAALHLDGGGEASRDFIFVDDIARGLVACAERGSVGGVYNLATGAETRIKDLALQVNALAENPTPLTMTPRRAWDHAGRRIGSASKAERELGFVARVNLPEGLRMTVEWTKQHLPQIEACVARHAAAVAAYQRAASGTNAAAG